MHKAGFVNIVGNPNVGKSTLMNALVGERISIATFKAQTTRHRIMGIYNTDEMQIVFSDTPGVLKPNYKLQESMLNFSRSALTDADVLLYVTDVFDTYEKNEDFVEKVKLNPAPLLLIINKIDLIDQEKRVAMRQKGSNLVDVHYRREGWIVFRSGFLVRILHGLLQLFGESHVRGMTGPGGEYLCFQRPSGQ